MQALEPAPQQDGWLQNSVHTLGSYAQTSTPAYTLTALFALSTPFGFASPAQAAAEAAAKLQRQQQLAQASAAASYKGSSSLVARLVANVQTQRAASAQTQAPLRTLPPFWQLAFFAAAFGTGGYMIDQGDVLNGSGVVTAWSLTYLLFKTVPSVKQLPRNPLALSLSAAVLTLGLGVHGSHYFDKTSWRGAIPSLAGDGQNADAKARSRILSFDTVGSTSNADGPVSIFAKPASSSATQGETPTVTAPTEIVTFRGTVRNNDQARTAAFLHRQAGAGSGSIIP
ncbi:uncharacterized protein UTRI_03854_B [Ustilago trichophora]|uniref:Uncharacterized protein n=1 Tax=Ustilago trichophora TaxID=86804 RepID=A0A5C3E1Z9_9BASI|nr:uncharacterized protein UTRI_03854_B [Ustilago trichophora]